MANQFMRDEVREKFRNVDLFFTSYYKFVFEFMGRSEEGYTVILTVGGNSDDIYRLDVNNDPEYIENFDPLSLDVFDSNGEKVYEEYNPF